MMEGYRNYQASPSRPAQQSRVLPSNPPQASQNDGPPRFQSRGHYLAARQRRNMELARRTGANVGFAAIHPGSFSRHWLSSPWKAYQGPVGKMGRAILSPGRAKLLDSMSAGGADPDTGMHPDEVMPTTAIPQQTGYDPDAYHSYQ